MTCTNSVLTLFSFLSLIVLPGRGLRAQDSLCLPFDLAGRLIVVEGYVNNQAGSFILDTGVGDLILNARYFQDLDQGATDQDFEDINQWGHRLSAGYAHFSLGSLQKKNERILLMDLQTLEQALKRSIHGTVGTRFFRDLELELDYVAREICLYSLDRQGRRLSEASGRTRPLETTPFRWKGHIPYIAMRAGGQELLMGLDTGAEINVLEKKWLSQLASSLEEKETLLRVRGFGKEANSGRLYAMRGLNLGRIDYSSMETVMVPQLSINGRLPVPWLDGLLGYEFFSRHVLSINFRNRELLIWELRRAAAPAPLLITQEIIEENNKNGN